MPSRAEECRSVRQTHLLAGAAFPLHGLAPGQLGKDAIQVEVRTHAGLLGGGPHGLTALAGEAQPRFRIERTIVVA